MPMALTPVRSPFFGSGGIRCPLLFRPWALRVGTYIGVAERLPFFDKGEAYTLGKGELPSQDCI